MFVRTGEDLARLKGETNSQGNESYDTDGDFPDTLYTRQLPLSPPIDNHLAVWPAAAAWHRIARDRGVRGDSTVVAVNQPVPVTGCSAQ